jgi:2-polyprenyl-3-methyl-5-hydroxy-6-metoxy-1,4-benzoquinol methylase
MSARRNALPRNCAPYEGLFKGKRYIAAGYQPRSAYGAYNCDCHQDIQNMTFADASFDAVLCIEVLEHVANPFATARELARVLRPNGRLLLTTPFAISLSRKAG